MSDLPHDTKALRVSHENLRSGDRGRSDERELLDPEADPHGPANLDGSPGPAERAHDLKRSPGELGSRPASEGAVSVRHAASRQRFEAQR